MATKVTTKKRATEKKAAGKKELADIGLVGLAVMGENLILNMESKGFTVAAFNRTVEKVDQFLEERAKGKNIIVNSRALRLAGAVRVIVTEIK